MRKTVLVLMLLAGTARAEVTLGGGFGVGGGAGHSGPMQLVAELEARGWWRERFGVFATAIAFVVLDQETAGTMLGGGFAVRWRWPTRRGVTGSPSITSLELSAGLGRHHIAGRTIFNSDPPPPEGTFDATGVGWIAGVTGSTRAFSTVLIGGGLIAYGAPRQGFAVVLVYTMGLSLF